MEGEALSKKYAARPTLLAPRPQVAGSFSNSSTNAVITSNPPCQNAPERMSMPASLKILAGASEPPAERIFR